MKKTLYIDMDGVICDFDSAFNHLEPRVRDQYRGREDQIPDLFALMDPIPGAIEAVTELTELFDTYVLSTVPWSNTSGASQKDRVDPTPLRQGQGQPLVEARHPVPPQAPQPGRLPHR